MGNTKSTTKEETNIVERFISGGSHYVTRISDGKQAVEARGRTTEEAEARAAKKWER